MFKRGITRPVSIAYASQGREICPASGYFPLPKSGKTANVSKCRRHKPQGHGVHRDSKGCGKRRTVHPPGVLLIHVKLMIFVFFVLSCFLVG
jgi:hypothetical protein